MAEKKQPIPKRVITEADVDRIMRTAPDYITEASDEVKDLFVAAEWAKEERDLSPKRYFDLVLNKDTEEEKTINIDFQQTVNVGAVVKTYGGDITAVRSANAKRLQYLQLDRAYQRAVLELNKAMGVRSRKPRNIVDYTGTIMELFGKFYTVTDVSKVMAKEYKIKVPEEELKKFYVENRDLITRRRAEYVLQNKDFRIATETGRLEVLNQMLVEVEIKNRAAGGSNVDYCNLILRIIEQARKEVKGNEIKMTVDGRIDINATLHAETNVMTVMKQMSINALVVGLTAAKVGLNPTVLISQLASSWYAKFNGFNGNLMDGEQVQLPSALIKQYDWDQIERSSKEFVQEFTPITEIIDEKEPEKQTTAETTRKNMLLRLKSMKAAKAQEDSRANPVTPDDKDMSLKENGMVLAPEPDEPEEPKGEFEIDYNLNKHYKQKKNMRVKGAIGESIARHKAQKEEGEVNVNKAEAEAAARRERRKARREAKKKGNNPDKE